MGRLLNRVDREGIWLRPDGLVADAIANVEAAVASAIDREDVVVMNDKLDGVISKGIASRLRLVLAERGIVRELDGDNERELDDGGGKKES